MDFTSLTFTDVTRSFGRRRALNRISFRCEAGEIVGLLGPNGAGKSTLLAIAGTLLQPSSGDVRYGDRTARDGGTDLRRRIGLLGHDLYLYPELSAVENRLDARGQDPVAEYSRGMRQRLALERALLHDPRLVLLDEPFTGLDDDAARALRGRLEGLRSAGRIVLLTTHDLEAIEQLIDRAVLLRSGQIVTIQAGAGLRERYRRASAGPS
jgi:ABC-type multidrug transport system ATPase subunit